MPKALHDTQEVVRLDERERLGTMVLVGELLRDLPPEAGGTLANNPQSARPVKKHDISLAAHQSGTLSRFFFASALMLCNEDLSTVVQSHSWHPASRHWAATSFLLKKSMQ